MVNKILLLSSCILLMFTIPVLAESKVEWDTVSAWTDVNQDCFWQTSFITSGDWSLGSNWAFFLKERLSLQETGSEWQGTLERCYLQDEQDAVRIKLGRQGVSWGIGWFFRPTDLITPLTPLSKEENRPGKDLATIRWSTSPVTALDLITGNQLAAIRPEWRIGDTNLRLLGVYQAKYLDGFGFDFQGGLAGFYGEGIYRWPDGAPDQKKFAGILGWQKNTGLGAQISVEYFRNDLSQAGPELANLLTENCNQEYIYQDENYLAMGLQIPWDQLTTIAFTGISNLVDHGSVFEGSCDFQITDNLEVRGGLMTIIEPDGTEFYNRGQGARSGVTLEVKYFF